MLFKWSFVNSRSSSSVHAKLGSFVQLSSNSSIPSKKLLNFLYILLAGGAKGMSCCRGLINKTLSLNDVCNIVLSNISVGGRVGDTNSV